MQLTIKRTEIAEKCLTLYMRDFLKYSKQKPSELSKEINQENIQDIITDLYHLAFSYGIKQNQIHAIQEMAMGNFLGEIE